jgi:hypothetical protein
LSLSAAGFSNKYLPICPTIVSQVGVAVKREVLGSNLGQDTDYILADIFVVLLRQSRQMLA